MSAALKLPIQTSSETRSERGLAPRAANDNLHLHLVKNNVDNPFVSKPFSAGSSGTGPRTLSYDSRGNVTALGGLFFTYDMSDQPTAISGNGPNGVVSGTYTYDGNLKRVRSVIDGKIIYNVYDAGGTLIHILKLAEGLNPEEKTDMIGKVARVTTSGGVDKITYLHNDHLGSANTGTDPLGNVLWREQYTPFGSTLTSPLANQDQAGFTGHIKDSATGLNYMQARYYDPLIGRFLSRDPIGFSVERPEMFGSYTYVGNDPVNATDPTGKRGNSCSMSGCISDPHMQKVGTGPLTNGDKVVLGVGSLFIPGPEDVVVGAIIATKIGQAIKGMLATKKAVTTCCFVAGTLVETEDGLRPIEEIEIGDRVLARNTETGETTLKAVTDLIQRHDRVIWEVSLTGGSETSEFFETTDDHPWWILGSDGSGSWKTTNTLSTGMIVTTADKRTMTIKFVIETDRKDATYNLTVTDFETYFVGKNKVLVHNCNVNLASDKRTNHILNGDETGGGHLAGTGNPGKSEFPSSMSGDDIMENASDIATMPNPNGGRVPQGNNRTRSTHTTQNGVQQTVVDDGKDIITTFPKNMPRNPK